MRKPIIAAATSPLVLSLIFITLNGCGGDKGLDKTEELGPVEIREYEGKKLSSVDDFRENSIKGPQHVDLENYQLKVRGLVESPKNYTYDEVINKHKYVF